jgi:lysozyme
MSRQLSVAGAKFIARYEGLRLHAYPDPGTGGKPWTIGIGHTGPEVHPGLVITQHKAYELLRRDAAGAAAVVSSHVKVPLNTCEFDALVSLVFNIGAGAFASSTVLRELNRGHRARAGLAFLMWDRAGGRVLLGLSRRRHAERRLFRGLSRTNCGRRTRP